MLKFALKTKDDLEESAKIAKRRQLEDERKLRIFNARQRLFGVDCVALKEQVNEKQKQKEIEAEEENRYNQELKRRAEIIQRKDNELKKQENQIKSELDEYRTIYQRPEDRREYDIENYRKNLKPLRTTDNDKDLGISSAQVFLGEDLMRKDRIKAQKDQQKAWIDQQIHERKQAERDRMKMDEIMNKAQTVRNKQTMEYDKMERDNRKKMSQEIANYNKQLAIKQEEKKMKSKIEEQEDNFAEIYNHLTSDMLTENRDPTVVQSALGGNRKITYMYRGMTDAELKKFRHEQKMYLEDKKRRENEKQMQDAKLDEIHSNCMRKLMLKQLELEKARKNQIKELNEENAYLAEIQKERNHEREKYLSKNQITKEYFDKFNTTTR